MGLCNMTHTHDTCILFLLLKSFSLDNPRSSVLLRRFFMLGDLSKTKSTKSTHSVRNAPYEGSIERPIRSQCKINRKHTPQLKERSAPMFASHPIIGPFTIE